MGLVGIEALRGTRPATLRTAQFDVPEWGGLVLLRELTGAERTQLLEGVVDLYGVFQRHGGVTIESGAELRQAFEYAAKVVQMTWVDGDGNQVVAGPADFDLLLQQDLGVIFNLATQALTLSKLAPLAVEEGKKNSVSSPNIGSGSGSP